MNSSIVRQCFSDLTTCEFATSRFPSSRTAKPLQNICERLSMTDIVPRSWIYSTKHKVLQSCCMKDLRQRCVPAKLCSPAFLFQRHCIEEECFSWHLICAGSERHYSRKASMTLKNNSCKIPLRPGYAILPSLSSWTRLQGSAGSEHHALR